MGQLETTTMTSQRARNVIESPGSDVAVTTKTIRRTVTAHGIVSFFFNAALLALTVNIAASAI